MFVEKTPSNNSQELREKREAKGLSLEDLFKKTRVRVVYLQAIENEEFHLLPVPIYAKNFIKIYSRALGVDSEPILKKYEDYLNSRKEAPVQAPEEALEEKHLFPKMTGHKIYWLIAFILTVVIVIFWLISKQYEPSSDIINASNSITGAAQENKGVNVRPAQNVTVAATEQAQSFADLVQNKNKKQSPVETQKILSSTSHEKSDAKSLKKEVSLPVENTKFTSNGKTSLLIIKATEETWLRIKADQNPSFQVVLKPGEKLERRAESFNIDIGNAGGIKVKFKGKDIETIGKAGEVVHLRLP
jgi:cytoskeleton protein RodZ